MSNSTFDTMFDTRRLNSFSSGGRNQNQNDASERGKFLVYIAPKNVGASFVPRVLDFPCFMSRRWVGLGWIGLGWVGLGRVGLTTMTKSTSASSYYIESYSVLLLAMLGSSLFHAFFLNVLCFCCRCHFAGGQTSLRKSYLRAICTAATMRPARLTFIRTARLILSTFTRRGRRLVWDHATLTTRQTWMFFTTRTSTGVAFFSFSD